MNAKKCKALRRRAMAQSVPGEPLRQLLILDTGRVVNNQNTFRGRYRALKRVAQRQP